MSDVNTNLKVARLRANFTQEHLAKQAGISRQHYLAVESGQSIPSAVVALRLARVLKTTVEQLFPLPEESESIVEAEWLKQPPDQPTNLRVQLAGVGSRIVARPLIGNAAVHNWLPKADGLITASPHSANRAMVHVLDNSSLRSPTLVMAGCDPSSSILADVLNQRQARLLWSEEPSRDALAALAAGHAHVAGCHLKDQKSGGYNLPWVKKLVPFPCAIVGFAVWQQGIIVGRSNPKSISAIEDLARRDVQIVNRQEGSGSRALLDRLLHLNRIPVSRVRGYDSIADGHIAVAQTVGSGGADAGVGIKAAADAFGLSFIPLEEERYDLVIPNHLLSDLSVNIFLDSLRRRDFKRQVEALGGYDTAQMGLSLSS
jgi:molybdate-binding protein/DNA-binding XRE family transcriptional regulator